jgi:hypothetical protein
LERTFRNLKSSAFLTRIPTGIYLKNSTVVFIIPIREVEKHTKEVPSTPYFSF